MDICKFTFLIYLSMEKHRKWEKRKEGQRRRKRKKKVIRNCFSFFDPILSNVMLIKQFGVRLNVPNEPEISFSHKRKLKKNGHLLPLVWNWYKISVLAFYWVCLVWTENRYFVVFQREKVCPSIQTHQILFSLVFRPHKIFGNERQWHKTVHWQATTKCVSSDRRNLFTCRIVYSKNNIIILSFTLSKWKSKKKIKKHERKESNSRGKKLQKKGLKLNSGKRENERKTRDLSKATNHATT